MAKDKIMHWLIIIGALALAFYLLRPLLSAIVFAAVIAVLFMPVQDWLKKRLPENACAAILTIFVAIGLILIIFLGVNLILNEFTKIYTMISHIDTKIIPEQYAQSFSNMIGFVLTKLINYLSGLISQLPRIMLSIMIFFATFFFFLKDGRRLYNWLKHHLPLPQKNKDLIFNELKVYSSAFIRIWILIGITQAVIAGVGFFLLGLPYYMAAAFAAFIFSVFPMIGPHALYLLVGTVLILQGNWITGIIVLAYGLPLSLLLDYLVRPYLAGKVSEIHPLIILLGIFGGASSMGFAGLILGPITLSIIVAFIKGHLREKNAAKK